VRRESIGALTVPHAVSTIEVDHPGYVEEHLAVFVDEILAYDGKTENSDARAVWGLKPPTYTSDVHATGLLHASLANRKLRRRPNEDLRKEKESRVQKAKERATAAKEKHASAQLTTEHETRRLEGVNDIVEKDQVALQEAERKLEEARRKLQETQRIAQVQGRTCREAEESESRLEEEAKKAVEGRDQAENELCQMHQDEERKRRYDEELEEQINRNSNATAKTRECGKEQLEICKTVLEELKRLREERLRVRQLIAEE